VRQQGARLDRQASSCSGGGAASCKQLCAGAPPERCQHQPTPATSASSSRPPTSSKPCCHTGSTSSRVSARDGVAGSRVALEAVGLLQDSAQRPPTGPAHPGSAARLQGPSKRRDWWRVVRCGRRAAPTRRQRVREVAGAGQRHVHQPAAALDVRLEQPPGVLQYHLPAGPNGASGRGVLGSGGRPDERPARHPTG
jgi:hypothetical protein